MLNKKKIGQNLRYFAGSRFSSFAELARRLDMKPQALQSYLDGNVSPGSQILQKLRELGCDINWLLTSDEKEPEYIPIAETERGSKQQTYKIVGVVPAGKEEVFEHKDWYDVETVDFDNKRHVFFKIDKENGNSMYPLIQQNDLVLIDLFSTPENGDIVSVRWDSTGGAIKILSIDEEDNEKIVLTGINQAVKPIFTDRSKVVMYKVVMIKKS